MDGFNGWYDWDTWNCALWIQNDEFIYEVARRCATYAHFLSKIEDEFTPDGARWKDADYSEMDDLIMEL